MILDKENIFTLSQNFYPGTDHAAQDIIDTGENHPYIGEGVEKVLWVRLF